MQGGIWICEYNNTPVTGSEKRGHFAQTLIFTTFQTVTTPEPLASH